ncbi:MAG: hypothetical protein LBH91_08865, partial [Prevotellaceae bacterium]|nr:hypothetical protein [Prevotellaceae bacterium]
MKKHFILTLFFIFSSFCLQAQSKWYIAPSVNVANMHDSWNFNASLTIGHYLGEKYRIDIWGSYIFPIDNDVSSISALFTKELWHGNWMSSGSIGAGMQKSKLVDHADFIIPVRCHFGYRLTNRL